VKERNKAKRYEQDVKEEKEEKMLANWGMYNLTKIFFF
jgi:hypothetical protein